MAVVFAREIKRLRLESGISQTSLARSLGVRQSTVAMWESGKNNPGYETLIRIADFFGVGVDVLCESVASVKLRTAYGAEVLRQSLKIRPAAHRPRQKARIVHKFVASLNLWVNVVATCQVIICNDILSPI